MSRRIGLALTSKNYKPVEFLQCDESKFIHSNKRKIAQDNVVLMDRTGSLNYMILFGPSRSDCMLGHTNTLNEFCKFSLLLSSTVQQSQVVLQKIKGPSNQDRRQGVKKYFVSLCR